MTQTCNFFNIAILLFFYTRQTPNFITILFKYLFKITACNGYPKCFFKESILSASQVIIIGNSSNQFAKPQAKCSL